MTELQCKVIPVVKSAAADGRRVKIKTAISVRKKEWMPLTAVFCECAEKIFGVDAKEGEGGIVLSEDTGIAREAYRVQIEAGGSVMVFASDYCGAAYGVSTLLQLAELCGGELEFPCGSIEDAPDKDYRGLMIDLARKWHPFSTLLHYVDLCFFYKVKYLHLHFMDDESYTLPSKAFPKLPSEGRSYTFEQIQTLCGYAKSRGVTLVPELEMPGHATVLTEAYPEPFANRLEEGEKSELITENGVSISGKSVICAGSAAALEGMKRLADEVLEMFAGFPYLHLGGDEVNTKAWDCCPVCREYMKANGISDAQELYCDFTGKMTDYVLAQGITPILWEGFPQKYADKISKKVIVIGWECHYQNPDELLEGGYPLINCTWQPLYVVPSVTQRWGISDILKWNVYEWQHWWEKSDACLNPFHLAPTGQVLGAQLCAWLLTYEQEIAFVAENLAALSERTWSVKRVRSDEDFYREYTVQSEKVFALIAER